MTRYYLLPLVAASLLSQVARAETLIFMDNFNTGLGQLDLDPSPLDGRRTGTEATLMMRSAQRQMVVFADQLYMWGNPGGRVRFQNDTSNWTNWAALPSANGSSAAILAAKGLTVDFDIRYTFNTDPASFIGFAVGFKGSSAGEPAIRITDAETDYALRIGKDGNYTRYKNGALVAVDPVFISPTLGRHVKMEFYFSSFADGSPVIVKTTVTPAPAAGQVAVPEVVSYDTFSWNGNAGELYMEMENKGSDTYFDDMKITTTTVDRITYTSDPTLFRTGAPGGRAIGDFMTETLRDASGTEASTYTLVAGTGDTDNSKFNINPSGQLVTGSYNFKQNPAGTSYSVRVRSTGKTSGTVTEQVFTVKPVKDDDNDMLPDDWELSFPGNTSLANLTGLKSGPGPGPDTGDYDGDGMSDLDEYDRSLSTPGYSPFTLDSDGDGINDDEEEFPTLPGHVVTSALLADTDGDGINDGAEYTLGTDPTIADTDGDGSRDGFEVAKGSNPLDINSRPALPTSVKLVQVTSDASTGIATSKTYTHKVSGGAAATVNGVAFDALTTTAVPPNFVWTMTAGNKSAMTASNLGEWVPDNGGVTTADTGVRDLFDNFTYSSVNTNVSQTFELTGLVPGQTYESKLFIRKWSNTTIRPIDVTYTNGTEVVTPFNALMYDRPGVVLKNDNNDSALYVSYTYVAQGTSLKITLATPPRSAADNGSAHMYAMSNEVVGTAVSALQITGVTRAANGSLTLTFKGAPSTTYQVTKSTNLTAFAALTTPLSATTDASGNGTATVPATETTGTKAFFRLEQP